MGSSPSQDEIMLALKESGYLMEQEVATQLEALDFHVTTNKAFEDSDEGKSREMDVHAIKRIAVDEERKLGAYIEIIAECKNSANPFVFIGRPKNAIDNKLPPLEYRFPIKEYRKMVSKEQTITRYNSFPAFFHLGFDNKHYEFGQDTKAVQFCRINRRGKNWHANHGDLYNSIFFPMAKAVSTAIANRHQNGWKNIWFTFPLVVVSGDILYVDSTDKKPTLQDKNYVTFKRDIKSDGLKGLFSLDFVKQQWLEGFVEQCINPLADKASNLIENDTDFLLNEFIS